MSEAYRAAGVDIDKGNEAVERMKQHVARTNRPEVIGGLGGFGGLFRFQASRYTEPVLVSGTDGVGTKLKIAFMMGIACSLLLTAVGWLWHQVFLGMVVGVSLITAFLVSTSMATVMPIVLKRVGVDPAVAAGPFVTTANDITGIAIYLTLATVFLEYLR